MGERSLFLMIGFWLGMMVMAAIKGDNFYAFWEGLTNGG